MKNLTKIYSKKAPAAVGPYSQAIKFDNLIFCSGQIGLNPKTNKLENSIEKQTTQVLKNLQQVLLTANSNFENVLQTQIYLTQISDFEKINKIYSKFFKVEPQPARITVEVSNLPKNALIEISCIAVSNK